MPNAAPLATHKRFGFRLDVYDNRLEVRQMGFLFVTRRSVIPFRSIASIDKHANTSRITVHTNDGKKHTFVTGWQTPKIYDAIMAAM